VKIELSTLDSDDVEEMRERFEDDDIVDTIQSFNDGADEDVSLHDIEVLIDVVASNTELDHTDVERLAVGDLMRVFETIVDADES
jgi:hypothetical protein